MLEAFAPRAYETAEEEARAMAGAVWIVEELATIRQALTPSK